MLKLVTILIFTGLNLISSAQSCIPDYIDFYLQSQVDSFQINYPGCIEIEGDVIIRGDDITNLDELLVLTSIGGDLKIENTSSLINLYGLNNISFIGEGLNIEDNESLLNLSGLIGLVQIDKSLNIEKNPSLTSLTGLDNLTTIGVDLNIGCSSYSWTGNPLLNNLSGLNSLTTIGNSLSICNNYELTDLSGIENLTSVENINISSNDNLSSLTGLQGVTNVIGYLSVSWSDLLTSLYGLNNLTTAGNLTLYRLPSLDDLGGLERLSSVSNDLTILLNLSLDSLASLDSLTYIGGKLTIEQNYDLIDLSGLENLTEIGKDLDIRDNYSLSSITALSSVTSIGGDLIILGTAVNSLVGLSGVTSIDGNLFIRGNDITSLSGIENINAASIKDLEISGEILLTDCAFPNICEYLSDPHGAVDIYENGNTCNDPVQIAKNCGITLPCLPFGNYYFNFQSEIDSFQTNYPNCTDLKGDLILYGGWGGGSGAYTNLDGLSVVTSIDGVLAIAGAYNLTTLSGLDNIDAASISDLYINYCPLLSECEVQSICNYIANPNGEVNIIDNANGCNNPEEIQHACETISIKEHDLKPQFKLFPNPTSHYLFIDNQNSHEIEKILIYNTFGQVIYLQEYKGPMINISELYQGIYILEIISDELRTRMKFVVGN